MFTFEIFIHVRKALNSQLLGLSSVKKQTNNVDKLCCFMIMLCTLSTTKLNVLSSTVLSTKFPLKALQTHDDVSLSVIINENDYLIVLRVSTQRNCMLVACSVHWDPMWTNAWRGYLQEGFPQVPSKQLFSSRSLNSNLLDRYPSCLSLSASHPTTLREQVMISFKK